MIDKNFDYYQLFLPHYKHFNALTNLMQLLPGRSIRMNIMDFIREIIFYSLSLNYFVMRFYKNSTPKYARLLSREKIRFWDIIDTITVFWKLHQNYACFIYKAL